MTITTTALGVLLSVAVLAACGNHVEADNDMVAQDDGAPSSLEEPNTLSADGFWHKSQWAGVSEVYPPSRVAEQAELSDAVVLGRFSGRCEARTVTGDVAIDTVTTACINLSVDRVLRGSVDQKTVRVELFGAPVGYSDQDLPQDQMVAFLTRGTGAESDRYGVLNSTGIITSTARSVVDFPLAVDAPSVDSPFFGELVRSRSWEEFLLKIEAELIG